MRSTTSASMETPGPFEKGAAEGLLQHDAAGSALEAGAAGRLHASVVPRRRSRTYRCTRSTRATTCSFSTRSSSPPTCARCYGAATNAEGWAHYCEQMMLDEGFHADDPRYRLAQLQDALLRDVRFIAGIKMHTEGMTVEQADDAVRDAGTPAPSRRSFGSEARHGGPAVRLLHDGKTDDPEVAGRLQSQDGRVVHAAEASTTRSSSWGRCRCRSSGKRCWVKPATSSSAGPCIGHQGCYARWTDRRLKRAAPNKGS